MNASELTLALKAQAVALGFHKVAIARATPLERDRAALAAWLRGDRHATMAWMAKDPGKRSDPKEMLPGCKSVVALAVNYWPGEAEAESREGRARVARYAWGRDYHKFMGRKLKELAGWLTTTSGAASRTFVDTGPVLERAWAARAGVGFVGKNAMVISRRDGNWLLLAAILTRIEFAADAPIRKKTGDASIGLLCGKCTRCLDACPTQAFAAPGVVDARRCISYQTIENKGIIPRELRAGIGAHIYGCDVCLEVCPWNRFAREGRRLLLAARHDLAELELGDILDLTPERYATVFRRTPIKRLKLTGLLRNACVVAGNAGDATLLPRLVRLAAHESALVRAHAVWAVMRLAGKSRASTLLHVARRAETDVAVLAEYSA